MVFLCPSYVQALFSECSVCETNYVRVNGIMCALCARAALTIVALCAHTFPHYVRPYLDLLVCF